MRQNKKSANGVLRELLLQAAAAKRGPGSTEEVCGRAEYLVDLDGSTFRVEMRPQKRAGRTLTSSVCDLVEKLWDTSAQDISAVFGACVDDPVDALASFIEEAVLLDPVRRSGDPDSQTHALAGATAVVISPFRPRSGGVELDVAPEEWNSLVRSVVESNATMTAVGKEHKEKKAELDVLKKSAEASLISDLDALPPGSIQRVFVKDEDGGTDTYYVRVKPPRRPQKRRISCAFFRKSLKVCLSAVLSDLSSTGSVADPDVGQSVSSALRGVLEAKESRDGLDGVEEGPRRVSLDKTRSRPAEART
jgi:hypothetical protein